MQRPTQAKGLLVTSTDYGQGATLTTAALARFCYHNGIQSAVMTPAETGLEDTAQPGPAGSLLKWAAQSPLQDEVISPNRFSAGLDPAQAASTDGRKIDFNALVQSCKNMIEQNDFTLIDAGGGLMVPLAGGLLMADFANMLDLPVLIITSPQRGAVNQTLMALYVARQFGLKTAGYMINRMPLDKSQAEEKLPHSLATMTMDELLGVLPEVEGNDQEKIVSLAESIASMKTISFLKPYLPG